MVQEQKQRKTLAEHLWGRIELDKLPKVDNEKVEKLLKGGYLFGFTASDLLIILSAILTLFFLQIQPYLIPYLEGRLDLSTFKIIENKFIEEQVSERPLDVISTIDKSSSLSSTTQTSSPSSSLKEKSQLNTQTLDLIYLSMSKDTYNIGEAVKFTITNHSDVIIYFTYGCSRPQVYKIEDRKSIPLIVNITEEVPPTGLLKPNQTKNCSWDQIAWQDSSLQGTKRYQNYIEMTQVPPGEFQLRLDYFFDESDIFSNEKAETTWSPSFGIE